MKSSSCSCDDECQQFNLGVIIYKNNAKLNIEDICTQILKNTPGDKSYTESENMAGPSSRQQYNVGDYVLVKFPIRKMEYLYVAIINQIDNEEGEIIVTFMKNCDDNGHIFNIDERDVSDAPFDHMMEKLPNPDVIIKGKRRLYLFKLSVPN
ncbi:hypothetical protein HHI36_005533 [Cryptolaemus montrouzieri]|uniref:Uncharacterized protein n=1 Tax=Cryptolaemus montrouzieri TaxID=559131 RepID=A0ABD2NUE9_9CUCU